jgi:hypothetical protein
LSPQSSSGALVNSHFKILAARSTSSLTWTGHSLHQRNNDKWVVTVLGQSVYQLSQTLPAGSISHLLE